MSKDIPMAKSKTIVKEMHSVLSTCIASLNNRLTERDATIVAGIKELQTAFFVQAPVDNPDESKEPTEETIREREQMEEKGNEDNNDFRSGLKLHQDLILDLISKELLERQIHQKSSFSKLSFDLQNILENQYRDVQKQHQEKVQWFREKEEKVLETVRIANTADAKNRAQFFQAKLEAKEKEVTEKYEEIIENIKREFIAREENLQFRLREKIDEVEVLRSIEIRLNNQLHSEKQRIQFLTEELSQKDAQTASIRKQNQHLEKRLKHEIQNFQKFRLVLKDYQAELLERDEELVAVKAEMKTHVEAKEREEQIARKLESEVTALRNKLETVDEKLQEAESIREAAKAEVEYLSKKLNKMEDLYNEVDKELTNARGELMSTRTKLLQAEQSIETLTEEATQWKVKKLQLEAETAKAKESLGTYKFAALKEVRRMSTAVGKFRAVQKKVLQKKKTILAIGKKIVTEQKNDEKTEQEEESEEKADNDGAMDSKEEGDGDNPVKEVNKAPNDDVEQRIEQEKHKHQAELLKLQKVLESDLRKHLETEIREEVKEELEEQLRMGLHQRIERDLTTKMKKEYQTEISREREKWRKLLEAEKQLNKKSRVAKEKVNEQANAVQSRVMMVTPQQVCSKCVSLGKVRKEHSAMQKDLKRFEKQLSKHTMDSKIRAKRDEENALLLKEKDMLLTELTLLNTAYKKEVQKLRNVLLARTDVQKTKIDNGGSNMEKHQSRPEVTDENLFNPISYKGSSNILIRSALKRAYIKAGVKGLQSQRLLSAPADSLRNRNGKSEIQPMKLRQRPQTASAQMTRKVYVDPRNLNKGQRGNMNLQRSQSANFAGQRRSKVR
eukprot:g3985.t1